jgi:hypothetical protein
MCEFDISLHFSNRFLLRSISLQNLLQNSTYDPELLKQKYLDRKSDLKLGCFRAPQFQFTTDCDPSHSLLTDWVVKRL